MYLAWLLVLLFAAVSARHSQRVNVGSVLFTDSDNLKQCWSMESIALLTSRMILEDILPSKNVLKTNDDQFVNDIIAYFRLILDVVRKLTYGKSKHIMLLALTDILGGYLNYLVLPMAKNAYYSGNLDYDTIQKLFKLFDELKCFLRTNGKGWSKPITQTKQHPRVQPLPLITVSQKTDPCKGLVYGISPTSLNTLNKHKGGGVHCELNIPLPFLDSRTRPSAIAVPFKTYALRNIESRAAAFLLVKYYVASYKCLIRKNSSVEIIQKFEGSFNTWIQTNVLPHLSDDKFYSAFGGIYRIVETLKRHGAINNEKLMGNYNLMPEVQEKETEKEIEEVSMPSSAVKSDETKKRRSSLILLALLCTIFIWFFLGSLFICYRIRVSKERKRERLKEIDSVPACPSKCTIPECPKQTSMENVVAENQKNTSSTKTSRRNSSSKSLTKIKSQSCRCTTQVGMVLISGTESTKMTSESESLPTKPKYYHRIKKNAESTSGTRKQTTSDEEEEDEEYSEPIKKRLHRRTSSGLKKTKSGTSRSSKLGSASVEDTSVQSSSKFRIWPARSKASDPADNEKFVSKIPTPRKKERLSKNADAQQTKRESLQQMVTSPKSSHITPSTSNQRVSKAKTHVSLDLSVEEDDKIGGDENNFLGNSKMTGIYLGNAESNERKNRNPYIFGYDFQTTSTDTGKETTDGGGSEFSQGNISR